MSKCIEPGCGAEIQYSEHTCGVCGAFHSYPNVRAAQEERAALLALYNQAKRRSIRNGLNGEVKRLEAVAINSRIVINADIDTVYMLARDSRNNYASYHKLVASGVRKAALQQHHRERAIVDDALFPGYGEQITFGAMTCDGAGLTSYGAIGLFLKGRVAPKRASLLVQNSFDYFKRHFKGLSLPLPAGHRAAWEDRGKLALVKVGDSLHAGMTDGEMGGLVLKPGATRKEDDFIEVHIYDLIDIRAIECAVLMTPLRKKGERGRWKETVELLSAAGVRVED